VYKGEIFLNEPFEFKSQVAYSEQEQPEEGGVESGYTYVPGLGFMLNNPETQERRRLHYAANNVGVALILYVVISLFATMPVVLLLSFLGLPIRVNFTTMQIYGAQSMLLVVNLIIAVLKLGLPALYLSLTLKNYISFRSVMRAPRAKLVAFSLPMVLAVSVVGSFLVELLQRMFSQYGWEVSLPGYMVPSSPLDWVLSLVLLTVVPAFLEEYLFRGVIMQGLRCFGDGVALLASAIFFALAHFNAMQATNAFLMGLVIGYFVLRTGSLWTGIILHFLVNLLSFFEMVLFSTVLQEYAGLVGNLVALILLATGILAFLLFVRKEPTAFTIPLPENSQMSTRQRAIICFGSAAMVLALLAFVFVCFQVV
jgi:membrane protease YdiL (CAAX protease family)